MAVRKLKDDDGNTYDVEVPETDDDDDDSESDGDSETIFLDEEDIEWLRRKRREDAEASRTSQTGKKPTKTASSAAGKTVKIRAKQPSTGSRSQTTSRKRTLRLA